jgi:molybdopterin biosynthesis enzyme
MLISNPPRRRAVVDVLIVVLEVLIGLPGAALSCLVTFKVGAALADLERGMTSMDEMTSP